MGKTTQSSLKFLSFKSLQRHAAISEIYGYDKVLTHAPERIIYFQKISIVILIAEIQPANSPRNMRIRVSAYIEWFTLATNRVIVSIWDY